MMSTIDPALAPFLRVAFSLFVACFITCSICGFVLFFMKSKRINAVLKHPYLEQRPFAQYPFAIRATIFLDYFFRLAFPGASFWVIGESNRLLKHIQPKQIPLDVKWPLIGFWGACWLGLLSMIVLWGLLLFAR
ncbi:membrane protein [Bordetella ansorpii]|uniref:Membrane protein n=1 Tax=Bordetella ansorpii TaxID=288768 RepID=A0A157RJY4_9BORD|nr:hypothetical protein [Bordetella ansorpii]SAI58283.1 membrane protein [Bordetella ansorpii]